MVVRSVSYVAKHTLHTANNYGLSNRSVFPPYFFNQIYILLCKDTNLSVYAYRVLTTVVG